MNQSSGVCLPEISESKKLIWVHSHQIDLQMDGAAELEKAFDKFPYLTQKQTAALAQRCCLHPDQVKVWFMKKRLCYGISWDYKDIHEVQRKFKSSQEDAQKKTELQNRMGREVETVRRKRWKWKRDKVESDPKLTQSPWKTKSETQLAEMRKAFKHCQYPEAEQYSQLAVQIGVPRHFLVQWYSDMRYYMKKTKPWWMSEEVHREVLTNIQQRQRVNVLARGLPNLGGAVNLKSS